MLSQTLIKIAQVRLIGVRNDETTGFNTNKMEDTHLTLGSAPFWSIRAVASKANLTESFPIAKWNAEIPFFGRIMFGLAPLSFNRDLTALETHKKRIWKSHKDSFYFFVLKDFDIPIWNYSTENSTRINRKIM